MNFIINLFVFVRWLGVLCLIVNVIIFAKLLQSWDKLTDVSLTHCAGILKKENEILKEWNSMSVDMEVCRNTPSLRSNSEQTISKKK